MNTTQSLYRFHIGLDTKTGKPTTSAQRARAMAEFDLCYPDGYTRTDAVGLWRGTRESAWIVDVYSDTSAAAEQRARALARSVRTIMDQEAVGLAILPVIFQVL